MKESISAISIFQVVILFILLFTAIMCLTINNANAFGIKDEITNIIELSDGNFLDSRGNLNDEIIAAIDASSYRTTGKCEEGYTGFQRDGSKINGGSGASVCIKCVNVSSEVKNYLEGLVGANNVASQGQELEGYYYQVVVFYQLDIPVIKQVYDFKTKGETKLLYGKNAGLCS